MVRGYEGGWYFLKIIFYHNVHYIVILKKGTLGHD